MAIERRGQDMESIRSEIVRIAPVFEGEPIARLGEGMDSLAVLVGEAFVFRFSKHAEAAIGLGREIALLPALAPRLPLAIPRFEHAGVHSITGLPFVGYGLIPGDPLDRPLYDSLSDAAQGGILDDLVIFLDVIHAFPIDDAACFGIVPYGGRAKHVGDLARARVNVFPRLEGGVRREIESRLGSFVDDDANFANAPKLLHADLWPEHVLFSRGPGRLAGIIDFGDVSIGDPDRDLTFLATRLGPGFFEGLLRRRPATDRTRLAGKILPFALFNAIDDALIGLDRGDHALVGSALAYLSGRSGAVLVS